MKTVFCFVLLCTQASAATIAEFGWLNQRTATATAQYTIGTLGYTENFATKGLAHWTTIGQGTSVLEDGPILNTFETLWTSNIGHHQNIQMRVQDEQGEQYDINSAKYGGTPLDPILNVGYGNAWFGHRFLPQLGVVFAGYDITSLEKITTATSQTIRVHGEPLSTNADVNGDGAIDAADYVAIRNGTQPGMIPIWRAAYATVAGGSLAAVPEPATIVIVLLVCVTLTVLPAARPDHR